MSVNKLSAALLAGAFLASTAYAADEKKPADMGAAAKDAKPKAKPHNHAAEGGRGMPAASGAAPSGKKPLHDHNKEHKQQ